MIKLVALLPALIQDILGLLAAFKVGFGLYKKKLKKKIIRYKNGQKRKKITNKNKLKKKHIQHTGPNAFLYQEVK